MLNQSRKRLAAAVSGGGAGDAFGSGGATSRSGGVARGVSDSDDPESDGACAGTACNTTISDMPHDKILQCAECRRRWHHACYARENGDVDCTELVDWNCKDCIKLDEANATSAKVHPRLLFFNGEYHRIDALHSGGAASGSGGAPGGASGSQGAAAGSGVAALI